MPRYFRAAYPLAFVLLVVLGFVLEGAPVWAKTLIGLGVMAPIVAADLVMSRRSRAGQP